MCRVETRELMGMVVEGGVEETPNDEGIGVGVL
jgi:hypothetical protein